MSSKFPQIENVNYDGQSVPFTKPQHYKKGSTTETELTGHDNPLPTKDVLVSDKIDELKLELGKIDIPDADYTPLLTKLDELNTSIADNKVVFPVNQKVSDSGVFSKLAEIEAEIKDIKERMEGTFDTRLTGSIVEIHTDKRTTTLAPGESIKLGDRHKRQGGKISISFRGSTSGSENDYEVRITHLASESDGAPLFEERIKPKMVSYSRTQMYAISDTVIGTYYEVVIVNASSGDRDINSSKQIVEVI